MRKSLICTVALLALTAAACGSGDASPTALGSERNGAAVTDVTTPPDSPSGTSTSPTDATPPSEPGATDATTPGTDGAAPSTDPPGSEGSVAPTPSSDTIDWKALSGSKGVEQASLDVPIDYTDPSKGNFSLHLVRHLAEKPKERIGTLLVNPGGPGFGGSIFAESAEFVYAQPLLDRFDILGWDPRGTGQSTPAIDCITDYDHFFDSGDITPDTPEKRQENIDLAKEFTNDCVTKNAKILQFVGTNNSARDMDTIRRALGEDKISYFGFSYGSELGATWATLFPDTVRAAVLDGAVDPNVDLVQGGLDQTKGFEDSLDTFLAKCSADTSCPFNNGGNAAGAFDDLMAKIDATPLPALAGRPPLTRGAALTGVTDAMYSDATWPELEQALADAQKGDGSGLMNLYDSYFQRQPDGSYDDSLEAFNTILCMDTADRPTVEEEDANAAKYTAVAPRLAPAGSTGSYQCSFWPASTDPRIMITGKGAGPILVVGTTGDPATPLEGTRQMAKSLEQGVLLVVDADQHTGYDVNECSRSTVDDYLVDPLENLPADGKKC